MINKVFPVSLMVLLLSAFSVGDEPDSSDRGERQDRPSTRTTDDRKRDERDRGPELRPPETGSSETKPPKLYERELDDTNPRGFDGFKKTERREPNLDDHEGRLQELRRKLNEIVDRQSSPERRESAEQKIAERAARFAELEEKIRAADRTDQQAARPRSPEQERNSNQARPQRGTDRSANMEFQERIEQQLQQMREQAQRNREQREHHLRIDMDSERERDREHTADRINHLHQAAEHLRHAGQGELADRVMERADDLERSMHQREREHGDQHRNGPNPEFRELHARMDELRRAVSELTEQVHQLRRDRDR